MTYHSGYSHRLGNNLKEGLIASRQHMVEVDLSLDHVGPEPLLLSTQLTRVILATVLASQNRRSDLMKTHEDCRLCVHNF
jgi:hypothetical protein